ncbi:unnamed protein product, partial [Brassica napus]
LSPISKPILSLNFPGEAQILAGKQFSDPYRNLSLRRRKRPSCKESK